MRKNNVPFFRLIEEGTKEYSATDELLNFKANACDFFEISTEVSIPIDEMERVSHILKNFK